MLFAGRQTLLLLADGEVSHDLGNLVDVSGGELREIRLVAAAPVGRDDDLVLANHVEDLLDLPLRDDAAQAHLGRVVDRNHQGKVALGQFELEVGPLFALQLALHKVFDNSRPVVGIYHFVAFVEHKTPSPEAGGFCQPQQG